MGRRHLRCSGWHGVRGSRYVLWGVTFSPMPRHDAALILTTFFNRHLKHLKSQNFMALPNAARMVPTASRAVELNGVRYVFAAGNYTRDEAQATCSSRGGALAAIASSSEQVWATKSPFCCLAPTAGSLFLSLVNGDLVFMRTHIPISLTSCTIGVDGVPACKRALQISIVLDRAHMQLCQRLHITSQLLDLDGWLIPV